MKLPERLLISPARIMFRLGRGAPPKAREINEKAHSVLNGISRTSNGICDHHHLTER
jgi:hypothetical protein